MEDNYKLLMSFIDESDSFVHGFECGKIWEQMISGREINTMVHKSNMKQLEMICEYHNYHSTFTDADETWMKFTASPKNIISTQAPKN